MKTIKKVLCKACNWKGYYTIYQWGEGWFTDFWPMKYINTKSAWIEKRPCVKCDWIGMIEKVSEDKLLICNILS